MCGIAGLIDDAAAETLLPAAQKMVAALRHRGPDSCGVISSAGCLLANTRLAILDLSERGRQPMSNLGGTVWITYNGETYNACELRRDLIEKGYSFRSTTDTEVVLHLYEEYGDLCVKKMQGMFAFAIWDARLHKLLLARDALGIKPLYFARRNRRLIFASEVKALLASDLIEPRMSPQALRVYLQLGHVPPPWTMLAGVEPLPPGHVATWQDGAWNLRAYRALDRSCTSGERSTAAEAGDRLGDVLFGAMRRNLISDVPIALFLSGGADSACLGALARKAGNANLTAVTIGFSESEFDETALSRQTARQLGLPLESVQISAERVMAGLDDYIRAMDQPTVDGLNSYWISKIVAEQGFKVALSGQGGDELFGGYTSWKWFERLDRIAVWARPVPSAVGRLFDRERWPYRWRKFRYLFGAADPFVASQMAVKTLFLEGDVALLTAPLGEYEAFNDAWKYVSECASQAAGLPLADKLSIMDIRTHLQPRLLRDLDALSMAHGLEVRPTFLDDEVVKFMLNMPGPARRHPKELLLQAISRFMPGELLADLKSRAKSTFTFPFARWLTRDLKPLLAETFSAGRLAERGILDPEAVSRIWQRFQRSPESVGWSRIWSLFVLARWSELMNVVP
jgi:asparagine synthase (glutamine-hydrolysing)